MPANIAHMVIAHKALQLLKDQGFADLKAFATLLDDSDKGKHYQAYMNLGSVGPDLYYYASMAKSAKDMQTNGFVRATGVTPWSYHLHSCRPNRFPLNLCEVLFSDAVRHGKSVVLDDDDMRKLAYIAGHLTHVAADQIIHPLVNKIAQPYYRDGKNRKKHQECEVFQDFFLYEEVYRDQRAEVRGRAKRKYDFFEQDFNKWVDCIPRATTRNTEDWFRHFLQRGFVEAYGIFPDEQTIEDSVDNLLLVLRASTKVGPYRKARDEYKEHGSASPMYQEYILEPDYVGHYKQAVQLSATYIAALYEVYTTLKAGGDFTERRRRRFLKIVSDADLSCPLQVKILDKAVAALTAPRTPGARCRPVFA